MHDTDVFDVYGSSEGYQDINKEVAMSRFLLFLVLNTISISLWSAETILVNRNVSGMISGSAELPAMSSDGSVIAFQSVASDLVAAGLDTNNRADIFVYDKNTNNTEIVSVDSAGQLSNGHSITPSISANGRFVAFVSSATNLVPFLFNDTMRVYVHDRQTGSTTLVSTTSIGVPINEDSSNPSISADGRYIAYESDSSFIVDDDTNGHADIFVYDRLTSTNQRVSITNGIDQANGPSSQPVISQNGRYIAFTSSASNFVPFDDNSELDIYRHDRQTNTTQAVSARSSVQVSMGVFNVVDEIGSGRSIEPSMSADGRFIAFATRANNLHTSGSGVMLEQIVLKDMGLAAQVSALELISFDENGEPANERSRLPSISADAQYVQFQSFATNLIDDDTNGFWDNFLLNRSNDNIERINVGSGEVQGTVGGIQFGNWSSQRVISDDGRYIAFWSRHRNLDPLDLNSEFDVFIRDRGEECDASLAGATVELPSHVWFLASIPCIPPSNQNTVGDILGDEFITIYGITWIVFTYDPTLPIPAYVPATLSTQLTPGQGFWIQQVTGATVTLDMPDGSRQVTGRRSAPENACTSAQGCFELPLSGAPNTQFLWNIIGNPYLDTNMVAFDDLRVTTASGSCAASQGCTMEEAAEELVVFNRFFQHNENGYTNRESGSILGAWEGYWVPELSFSSFNSPLIRFRR